MAGLPAFARKKETGKPHASERSETKLTINQTHHINMLLTGTCSPVITAKFCGSHICSSRYVREMMPGDIIKKAGISAEPFNLFTLTVLPDFLLYPLAVLLIGFRFCADVGSF